MTSDPDRPRRVIVLGSTGSIGTQTLEVIDHLNTIGEQRIEVCGLVAGRCSDLLAQQAQKYGCAVATREAGDVLGAQSHGVGEDAIVELIRREHERGPVDMVMAAIVGIAGLRPVIAALELGIDVALANKETLVAAGELVVPLAQRTDAKLLPVDSEHSALWQCLRGVRRVADGLPPTAHDSGISRVTLTASGGALRDWSADAIRNATPAEALAHPTWDMGKKVTIDSATLMNKGFEVMEARWLFGIEPERIDVLIQPTSTVHSLVVFVDGAVLAQLGTPDMRTAIQYAILRGEHLAAPGGDRLDLAKIGKLEFQEPDHGRFPMLGYAYEALKRGGNAGAVLNAANEVAVGAFLDEANADGSRMKLGRVVDVVSDAMSAFSQKPIASIDDVLESDAAAREWVHSKL
ncbi:MAG: 1-deoxy-D-xylulose-5-phosphate reductoisomerase [Planctomycetota bacterium]